MAERLVKELLEKIAIFVESGTDQLAAAANANLSEELLQGVLHGALGGAHVRGDLLVCLALDQKTKDFRLPAAEGNALVIGRGREREGGLRVFGDFSNDGGQFGRSPFVICRKPYIGHESFAIVPQPAALHGCAKLRALFSPESMMKVGEEGSYRMADQLAVPRRH